MESLKNVSETYEVSKESGLNRDEDSDELGLLDVDIGEDLWIMESRSRRASCSFYFVGTWLRPCRETPVVSLFSATNTFSTLARISCIFIV